MYAGVVEPLEVKPTRSFGVGRHSSWDSTGVVPIQTLGHAQHGMYILPHALAVDI